MENARRQMEAAALMSSPEVLALLASEAGEELRTEAEVAAEEEARAEEQARAAPVRRSSEHSDRQAAVAPNGHLKPAG